MDIAIHGVQGYVSAERNKQLELERHPLAPSLSTVHSPRCQSELLGEDTCVEQITDTTSSPLRFDGRYHHVKEAVSLAAKILNRQLSHFGFVRKCLRNRNSRKRRRTAENALEMTIEELDLSVRL